MKVHIRAASFERGTFCLTVGDEPIGKEIADYREAYRERESLIHYVNGSTSPDWLRMCVEMETEAA